MEDQPQNIAELEDRILKKDRTAFYNYCNQLAKATNDWEKTDDDDMNKLFDPEIVKSDERKKIISEYIVNDINDIETPEKISNSEKITNTVHFTDIETDAIDTFLALKLNGVIDKISYDEADGRIKLTINENFQGQILFTGDLTAFKAGSFPYEHGLITVELFDELRKEIKKHNEQHKAKQITFAAVPGNHDFIDTLGGGDCPRSGSYGEKTKKINNEDYKEGEIGFIKSKLMAIKVIAEIQKDYLERCRNENINIDDDDLEKIGYHFDINDKIKKLEDLINEMNNVLNQEKELQEFIKEYKKIAGHEDSNNKETEKKISRKDEKMTYQVPSNEKFKQFFWKTSDLLHTLIINDGQNKKRIMHNPVYLFDEETIYHHKMNEKKIKEALNNGNYDEGYVQAMKECFRKNRITETSCVIIDSYNMVMDFSHHLDGYNREYLYGNIFLTIPTFYGHEGNEKIDKWGAGICTDNRYHDPCEEDSISHHCLFVSEKVNEYVIKVEKYEKGFSQKKPKRVGVFYICSNGEKREEIEKKNDKIAELREEATNEIKKPNAVGKIYGILKKLINTGIKEYKQLDGYKAAKSEEKENLSQWYEKIKSLKRAFRSLHEYYENKEINLFNKKIKEAGISDDGILNTDVKIENTIDVKQIIKDIKNTLYDIDNFKGLIENTVTFKNDTLIGYTFKRELCDAGDELKKEENKNLLNDFITEICQELRIKKSDINNEGNEQEENDNEINTNTNQKPNSYQINNNTNNSDRQPAPNISITGERSIGKPIEIKNTNQNKTTSTNTNQNKTIPQKNISNQNYNNTNNYTGQQSSNIPITGRCSMKTPIIHKVNENDDEINTNTNQKPTSSQINNNIYNSNRQPASSIHIKEEHSTGNPIKDSSFLKVQKESYDINENIREKSKILDNLLSNGIPKNFSTTIEGQRKLEIERLDSEAIYHILTSTEELISRNRGNKLTRLFDSRKYRYNEFCELIEKKFKETKNRNLEIPDEKPLTVNEEDFKDVWNKAVKVEDLKDVFRDTAFFGCCG